MSSSHDARWAAMFPAARAPRLKIPYPSPSRVEVHSQHPFAMVTARKTLPAKVEEVRGTA